MMSEGSTVLFSRHGASQATRPESFRLGRTCTDWIVCPYLDTPILQRKRLQIADFADKKPLAQRLMAFVAEWNEYAHPFQWSTKSVAKVMAKCENPMAKAA